MSLSVIVWLAIAIMVVQKMLFHDGIAVKPPYEWVGEMFSALVALYVSFFPAYAIELIMKGA